MGDAYRRVSRVHRLPTWPRRTKRIDAQILRVDLDVDLFSFRQHGDGDGRSVNATAGFGLGHTLHAMDAGLVFQTRIDFVAFDQRDRLLQAADSGFRRVEDFHLPALA